MTNIKILDVIETAVAKAGLKIVDCGDGFIIIRDAARDIDYRVTLEEEVD